MSDVSSHPWVVMKFGGTSVSSVACWGTICKQAESHLAGGKRVLIVVSALSGVTNLLTTLSEDTDQASRDRIALQLRKKHFDLWAGLGTEPSDRFLKTWDSLESLLDSLDDNAAPAKQRALLLAHGELLSSSLGQAVLSANGLDAAWVDARDMLQAESAGDPDLLSVHCRDHTDPELERRLAETSSLHITQGFIAATPDGDTCLLGRGGSDTSAACFAARLQPEFLEIWTDVPGVFSADPHIVPDARLLRSLSYSEAQELASMGARVLHPPSIQPARKHGIPIFIKDTNRPEEPGTRIATRKQQEVAQVKGVVSRGDITLISMENPAMWQQAGFLADAFAVFKQHGYSVDLVSTSEATVTVSLDPQAPAVGDGVRFTAFLESLQKLCRVEVHKGCVSISLVGNSIRTILGRLAAALDVFQDRHVHMVTQSANDLNLTLVVDAEHATSLVRKLHQLLISVQADQRPEFGPSWTDLNQATDLSKPAEPWWVTRADQLVALLEGRENAYVYHLDSVRAAASRLVSLSSVHRVLYAVKANDHPDLLRTLAKEGLRFECVSLAEVDHVMAVVDGLDSQDFLFTPNFASRDEYQQALDRGIPVTVDNAWAILSWPELFRDREILLRLDLDTGYGHHKKVITSGVDSKFGISLGHLDEVQACLDSVGARVIGLHAHTGSGVSHADAWREQLQRFIDVLPRFPDVRALDLGGGFAVPDRRGRPGLDLDRIDQMLGETLGDVDAELWIEPGRYLVSEAGVLLSRVTQLKDKGHLHYLGINVGMNALIRPALYGAYHDMANLSRLQEPADCHYRVVGPICESGDVMGEHRQLPRCHEGDVILVANAGAYGRVMASSYNRRTPPVELTI